MNILIVAKTLSITDGQGRYALGLIEQLIKDKNIFLTILTPENPEKRFLNTTNIKIVYIPKLFNLSIGKIFLTIKYFFIFLIHMVNKDFVHFMTDLPAYLIFSPLYIYKFKSYFITAHGTFVPTALNHFYYKNIIKKILLKADKIFCVSNFTQQQIRNKIKFKNTVVINNGINFNNFNSEKKQTKEKNKIILGVGALKNRKGYDVSIRAVAELKNIFPDFKYYIVGDQSEKKYFDYLKSIIKEKKLTENIIFLQNISDQELINLYNQADVFILTPKVIKDTKFEGFGLVYLEAGACNLPVIGSLGCGAEDAIQNNQNGILVNSENIQEIYLALKQILTNQELARKMGDKGKQMAKISDWKNVFKKYQKFYENIIN